MIGNWLKTALLMAGNVALFSTHPATRDRVTRLLAMAR